MKLLTAFAALTLTYLATPGKTAETVVPGKSLWGIALGTPRSKAITLADKSFKSQKAKRQPARTHARGVVEDSWEFTRGDTFSTFEVFSQRGKVVQLRAWWSEPQGKPQPTFGELLRRYRLQKRVFAFVEPEGGGYTGFYYDDLKRGVCYTGGTQDSFLLTYRPDGILVHRPGVPAIAIEGGIVGKPVSGEQAQAYANAAEAERATRREIDRRKPPREGREIFIGVAS